jgi:hypothetical protein
MRWGRDPEVPTAGATRAGPGWWQPSVRTLQEIARPPLRRVSRRWTVSAGPWWLWQRTALQLEFTQQSSGALLYLDEGLLKLAPVLLHQGIDGGRQAAVGGSQFVGYCAVNHAIRISLQQLVSGRRRNAELAAWLPQPRASCAAAIIIRRRPKVRGSAVRQRRLMHRKACGPRRA